METTVPVWIWLAPTLMSLFLYGIAQGLVKKYSSEVSPALFCLYFVVAKAAVNIGYYMTQEHTPFVSAESQSFLIYGILAYVLDGAAWILYFESIVAGPITIVGTLSAAYPALTVLFAHFALGESLNTIQYGAVFLVILGCIGLSYDPSASDKKEIKKRWIPLAATALVTWGISQTIIKYAYSLPGANEANMALFNTVGGFLTLGMYGMLKGLKDRKGFKEFAHSFGPMAVMAGGDLGAIIGYAKGPASIVAPVSGAYPLVTLVFAYFYLKEKIRFHQIGLVLLILIGIIFTTYT